MPENMYRDYLTDDQHFYRQYLKPEGEPVGSSFFTNLAVGGAVAAGIAGGTAAIYKGGGFSKGIELMIDQLSTVRNSRAGDHLKSVRRWTEDSGWNDVKNQKGIGRKMEAMADQIGKLPRELQKGQQRGDYRRADHNQTPIIQDKMTELASYIDQYHNTVRKTRQRREKEITNLAVKDVDEAVKKQRERVEGMQDGRGSMEDQMKALMDNVMEKTLTLSKEQQDIMKKRTGYRYATVEESLQYLPEKQRESLKRFEERLQKENAGYSIMQKAIDSNILVKEKKDGKLQFADLRDFRDGVQGFADSVSQDFSVPFIKINPFRMFYVNELFKRRTPQLFADLGSSRVQPFTTVDGEAFAPDFVVGNYAYRYDESKGTFSKFNKPVTLIGLRDDGADSVIARQTKNMMDLRELKYEESGSFIKDKLWAPVARKLDIGYQEGSLAHDLEMGEPNSYLNGLFRKLHSGFGKWGGWKPYGDRYMEEPAFGSGAEFLVVPRHRTLKEVNELGGGIADYTRQFWAARNHSEDVTTSSFILYTLGERLNATISQMGLGLSSKSLGGFAQIMGNLTMKRGLPIVAGVEGIKLTNYGWEQMTGDEYEDQIANAFANTQMDIARGAEFAGITDWAKDMKHLLPGYEFITELPVPVITTEGMTPIKIGDLMPLDKTAEELEQYYTSGEEVVRKGRYWEVGTTPLTGGKIDYWEPNWFRRITSDWQYTDTLWGSKEEYWDNNAFTSPLNHFFLDPYHYDFKHYEDRPYMMTGGVPMIEEIPLIGGILNSTVGQIIKPSIPMHEEEWNNPGYLDSVQGFQLYDALGLNEEEAISSYEGPSPVFGLGSGGEGGIFSGFGGGSSTTIQQEEPGFFSGLFSGDNGYFDSLGFGTPLAYVTPSGNVQVMQAKSDKNLYELNKALEEGGITSTGMAGRLPMEEGILPPEEEPISAMHMAMDTFEYNFNELAGFYGWSMSLVSGTSADEYEPRIQTSSDIYSYNRGFWDSSYGNMGGDAMEILRRFIPRDAHKNYVNPLDNRMPTWMPGDDYFTNFQQGDPYTLVPKGEMRLPGESYEKIYGITDVERAMEMYVGGSTIGYGVDKIVANILGRDHVMDEGMQDILDQGTELHKQYEQQFKDAGIAIYTENYVEDEEAKIGGTYDMLADSQGLMEWALQNAGNIQYYRGSNGYGMEEYEGFYEAPVNVNAEQAAALVSASEQMTVDFKTRGDSNFDGNPLQFENAQQTNFYASQNKTAVNAILEFNRDDPSAAPNVHIFDYNPYLLQHSYDKVATARAAIEQMLEDGAIGRGDFYSAVDRYRILADVAPYSNQFRDLKSQLSSLDLTPEEREEIKIINDQLSARKEAVRTYDYRFKTANVEQVQVTVKRIVDNNTFITEEFSNNPIRLAGVYVPTGQDEAGQAATEFMRNNLHEGQTLTISVTADEQNLVNNDTYQTISAVVHSGGIRNLNKELIERGLAKEKEDDYSPAAVHARFSPQEIAFGSIWESIAHLDTPINTKLLHVASPLEEYQRREVYGKSWQDWANPVSDYFIPWYENWISKAPYAAVTMGTAMGALFGNNPYGRIIGGLIGGTASLLGVSYVQAIENENPDRAWIPERRRKEREVVEYFDTLEYLKNRRLFEEAADVALRREGFDVRKYIEEQEEQGEARSARKSQLEQAKRNLMTQGEAAKAEARQLVGLHWSVDDYMKAINKELSEIQNSRRAEKIGPIAADAIRFYQQSEQTLYGWDPGESIQNAIMALPKKERNYISKFMEAPEEERDEILKVVPDYVRRILQSTWGMEVDEKPTLTEYFQHHTLPDVNWAGWDSRADMDSIRLKVVQREGLDNTDFNIWNDDEQQAAMVQDNIAPDTIHAQMDPQMVKQKLQSILGEAGFRELEIDVQGTTTPGIEMDVDIRQDRRADIQKAMNENAYSLI